MTVLPTVPVRARTVTLLGVGSACAALQMLGRRAGSTREERAAALPGDDLVHRPQMRTDHAGTIDAQTDQVWPWLTRMGWHLAGWYTPPWVDRLLFPDNWPALDHLDPHLVRDLHVGDIIPDGTPGTAQYVVAQVEPPHLLVLRSTTHIPPGWDIRHGVACLIPADYVMATAMLRGLKQRVEAHPPAASGRVPLSAASSSAVAASPSHSAASVRVPGSPPAPQRGERTP